MSDILFTWFNDSKATRNYCIFGKKKLKSSTKQVVMRLLFCAMFWKAIYKYYTRFWFRKEIHNQLPSLEILGPAHFKFSLRASGHRHHR